MPNLLQLFRSQDLGYARIAAEMWGLEHAPNDLDDELEAMVTSMLDERLAAEVMEALGPEARQALIALAQASGRMPWNAFTRRFGEVRDMGAGRRDRERPHLGPVSAAEDLLYRGLLGRAFFEAGASPQEFAFIADDLLRLVPRPESGSATHSPPGRAATSPEHGEVILADDRLLDEATTLLAALRAGRPVTPDPVLQGLLECAGITQDGFPNAEQARAFLEAPRQAAMRMLANAWRDCRSFNELRLVPGITCEGPWSNEPLAARAFVLQQLKAVPVGTWWNLKSFVTFIKDSKPDFQRPAGDFDSWFIKREADGRYLRGFESWDEVDGALIRFSVTDVMQRLALVEIGRAGNGGEALAFRRVAPRGQARAEVGRLNVGSHGRISASRDVPRAVRYQLARFCEWDQQGPEAFDYRITPGSMERAAKQGLKVEHLLTLLAKHGKAGIPASITKALRRWEQAGTEARTESQVVLRVKRSEIIKELQRSRAARFLDQPLGPTAITVKPGAQAKVIAALAELGILGQDVTMPNATEPASPKSTVKAGQDKRKAGAKITARK